MAERSAVTGNVEGSNPSAPVVVSLMEIKSLAANLIAESDFYGQSLYPGFVAHFNTIALSFNGRTDVSGTSNDGSNPSRATQKRYEVFRL